MDSRLTPAWRSSETAPFAHCRRDKDGYSRTANVQGPPEPRAPVPLLEGRTGPTWRPPRSPSAAVRAVILSGKPDVDDNRQVLRLESVRRRQTAETVPETSRAGRYEARLPDRLLR